MINKKKMKIINKEFDFNEHEDFFDRNDNDDDDEL
jgi:hypothetical protein